MHTVSRLDAWLYRPAFAFPAQVGLAAWLALNCALDLLLRTSPLEEWTWLGIVGPVLLGLLALGYRFGRETLRAGALFGSLVLAFVVWSLALRDIMDGVLGRELAPTADSVGYAKSGLTVILAFITWIGCQSLFRTPALGPDLPASSHNGPRDEGRVSFRDAD